MYYLFNHIVPTPLSTTYSQRERRESMYHTTRKNEIQDQLIRIHNDHRLPKEVKEIALNVDILLNTSHNDRLIEKEFNVLALMITKKETS